jgi:hypothetical protein
MTRIVPSLKIAGDIDANTNSITNLSVPISSSDAASKSYVDETVNHKSRSVGTSAGTGAQQTIAHGLGAIPASISIVLLSAGVTSVYVWADATNIYPNITSGKGYKWMASL